MQCLKFKFVFRLIQISH